MSSETTELLEHHWALDSKAAEALSSDLNQSEQDLLADRVGSLSVDSVMMRDNNRDEIGRIYTGNSDKILIVKGPCSLDRGTDYRQVFELLATMQEKHPDIVFAFRGNGAKPRTGGASEERGGDWTGLWNSTDPEDREYLFDIYRKAMDFGIPILTEITGPNQAGSLAPFLSGIWLGARDMPSTGLRTMASAIHLPVGVKNGLDGKVDTVESCLVNIARSTMDNSGSGVDLGTIASSPGQRGIPVGILPVGEGNTKVGIIARGYELPKSMAREERREAALRHISELCVLAARRGNRVIIDGSHAVPPMFDIERTDGDRFPRVMKEIFYAISQSEIDQFDKIKGLLFEIGPNVGRTDRNWVITEDTADQLSEIIESFPRTASI